MDYSNRNQNDRYNDSFNDRDQNRRENDDNNNQNFGNRGNDNNRNQFGSVNQDRNWGNSGGNNDYQNSNRRDDNSGRRSDSNFYGGRGKEDNYGGNRDNQWGRQDNDRNQGYGNDRNQGWENSGRNRSDRDNNRNNDRNWFDRTKDEVSSWFGDDDADRRRRMDKATEGLHRGKGPKGYKRSDERVKEDINDRLSDDAHIDASEIEVTVSNGEVTLNGTVENRNEKRHAEDLADAISGVTHVQNNLRVGKQQSANTGSTDKNSDSSVGTTGSIAAGSSSTAVSNGHHKAKATH